jgi:hypothetical protein
MSESAKAEYAGVVKLKIYNVEQINAKENLFM